MNLFWRKTMAPYLKSNYLHKNLDNNRQNNLSGKNSIFSNNLRHPHRLVHKLK